MTTDKQSSPFSPPRWRASSIALCLLSLLAVCALAVLAGCKAKENTIKAESIQLITQVKQARDTAELIKFASPAFQLAAVKAGETLGLTADKLLPLTSFPLNIKSAVTLPEPNELTVNTRGRFADVSFIDDANKLYSLRLVQDRGKWYFFLDTPAEQKRYGEFKVK